MAKTKIKLSRTKIVLIALFAILLLFLLIKPSGKMSDEAQELFSLSKAIRQHYSNLPGYWGLNTQRAIELGVVPDSMVVDGKLTNRFGKEVFIGQNAEGTIIMPGMRFFAITYKNLSKKECVNMATVENGEEYFWGLMKIIINDKEFSWGGADPLPISREQALSFCKENNVIVWQYE